MKQLHYTSEIIENAINLLMSGKLPPEMGRTAKYRFRNRFLSKRYSVSTIEEGKVAKVHLLYDGKLVVTQNQIPEVLRLLYSHAKTSRNGIHSFFDSVRQRFEGITRADVEKFLKSQRTYQRFLPEKKKLSQPIITHHPLQQIQMDYIDLQKLKHHNRGYAYCLVLVDVFSKFAWVYPCKTREAAEQEVALRHLFDTLHIIPKVLHSDREFATHTIRKLATEYGFTAVWSSAYQPNANAVVERFNRTLKNMLYQWISKGPKFPSWIGSLQESVENYNDATHSTTKQRPIDLIKGSEKLIRKVDKHMIKTRKRKAEKEEPIVPYLKGNTVRVSRSIYPYVRKQRMMEGTKSYVPRWSENTYTIKKVFKPRQPGRIVEYQVEGLQYRLKHDQVLKVEKVENDSEFTNPEPGVKRRKLS
jgi:transposase InsO family protein